jgi:hypothetical protein
MASRSFVAFALLSALVCWSPTIAAAQTAGQQPTVQLDTYTGKPTHAFSLSGAGFAPGEVVDVYLGAQTTHPLASLSADGQGDIVSPNTTIPFIAPGDYSLTFVGQTSRKPVSVGFNVQGFTPWAVLDNYYIAPGSGVGVRGEDFIPGEVVLVYLNTRLSQPITQLTADDNGHFAVANIFALPQLTGNNQLIFVGQQSQTEVTATFAAATPQSGRD